MQAQRTQFDNSKREAVSIEPSPVVAPLDSIIEASEDAIISKDLSGTILTWNRGAAALYGYTAEEAIGRSITLLVPADRYEEEQAILAQIRAGQRIQQLETVRIRKSGVPIHVSLTISPIRERDRIVGASHVARDISERKRLEGANAQLASLVQSSDDPIISEDLAGTIQTWNPAAERVYGYSAAEAIGRNMSMLLPSGQEQEEQKILERIKRGEKLEHFETSRAKKDGTLTDVSLTISSIRDRAGNIVGACQIAREIGRRRQLEAANAQLAAIVESSQDAIVSKDLNGTIRTWNAGAERIYGYSPAEAIGRNISVLLPQNRVSEEQEILAKLRRGECVEHFETSRLRKDGKLIEVSLSISPIRDQAGMVIGASHVARDITEQKIFEQQIRQTQRLESLGVLAGGIAHDFNNLLTGIIGNASLTADTLPGSHPARAYLEDLMLAAERAADLTRQLLAYAGKGQFVIRPVNVSELVREIGTLLKASIPKTVTMRLELEDQLPLVDADRTQIQQLAMNLIINAAEAIGENRSGTVLVKTGVQLLGDSYIRTALPGTELMPGAFVYIEVNDDGCGMDEETKARIFEPFFTTKFTGRGLGLAAASGIVTAHRGAIRVLSTPNEGSTFKVFLPASNGSLRKNAGEAPGASRGTILVVDDEDIVRKVAKSALENHGYQVVLAANGKEAIEVFRDVPDSVSLIILDLTMPVMGGEEALRLIRAIRANVPVILSSGYSEAEAMHRFAGDRIAGFVQKPYTSAQLKERVDAVLGRN